MFVLHIKFYRRMFQRWKLVNREMSILSYDEAVRVREQHLTDSAGAGTTPVSVAGARQSFIALLPRITARRAGEAKGYRQLPAGELLPRTPAGVCGLAWTAAIDKELLL